MENTLFEGCPRAGVDGYRKAVEAKRRAVASVEAALDAGESLLSMPLADLALTLVVDDANVGAPAFRGEDAVRVSEIARTYEQDDPAGVFVSRDEMRRIAENASAHRVSSELNECIVCRFAALHNKSAVFALERIDIPALKETCRRIPAIS